MTAIIAEKPSVGRDIARVLGATEKKDGYMSGNGYLVTWALGHLVSLATPSTYGYGKASHKDLPIFPEPFRLVVRQIKTDRGMVTDISASKQLKIIDEVFGRCDSIIVATDAGREGELIFRYIYQYLGYTKPFKRLWISSLTDEAILTGMKNLKNGDAYDSLYHAADSRAKADWLVGMNASRALALASSMPNSSLGRVQTPTLAMICSRYKENRDFVSVPYWQLNITLERHGEFRQFSHIGDFDSRKSVEEAYSRFTPNSTAAITKAERKTTYQQAPLLYDLTALQKDCNIHHDMSADKTLAVAQSLYEKKYISYPRTGSRYISSDLTEQVRQSLKKIAAMPEFNVYGNGFDFEKLNMRCVNDGKITDHHALIITSIEPENLNISERTVYMMIAGRMLEAFSPSCEKETLIMEASSEGLNFRSSSTAVINPGWRAVFSRKEDAEKDERESGKGAATFEEGEQTAVTGRGMVQRNTKPKPLYTEATLLAVMETCGKNITDEEAKEAIKDLGIGTPATRAAIITTLFQRDYIKGSGKSLIPTDKGLYLYEAIKDMQIADVSLTGIWEKTLLQIEKQVIDTRSFMRSIENFTSQITREILGLKFDIHEEKSFACPKCGNGKMILRPKTAKCDNTECGLTVFRKILNKELSEQHLEDLLVSGNTKVIKGFKSKNGNKFDAAVAFDDEFNVRLKFQGNKKSNNKRK